MVKLTEAEWSVLQVLWEGERCSLGEVVSALEPTRHWRRNTVHTYLTRMEEKGLVERSVSDADARRRMITLTEKGKDGALSFKKYVSKSVRDRIYAAGLRFFSKLKNSRDVTFDITPLEKGYSVHCKCSDNGLLLMDMTLFAPDKEQADYIKSKIMINPTDFYCKVMDYIIENEEYIPSIGADDSEI